MRRDVPDAQLTLLGHTDAIGSDQFNEDLSMRRARNVFQALVNRGVNPAQLSTVAIGKNQPIASNETEEGRARNRRVEFLISASQDANLASTRPVERTTERVPVLTAYPADVSETGSPGKVLLRPLRSIPLKGASLSAPAVPVPKPPPPVQQQPAPEPPLELKQPAPFELAPLRPLLTN